MTKQDIILSRTDVLCMAREKANSILLDLIGKPEWDKGCTEQHLIDFAAIVAAAEREACYTIAKFNQANYLEHLTADQIKARG